MFEVNSKNTRTRCEICPKITIEHISHLVLIVNIEQVNAGWDAIHDILQFFRYTFLIFDERQAILAQLLELNHVAHPSVNFYDQ